MSNNYINENLLDASPMKKQKEEDETYRLLFWTFFLYTLVDTVFSLF